MDFFDWQGAGGVNSELLTTSATQAGGSAPPKKDAISWCVMGWDWYYFADVFGLRFAGLRKTT
ncbi:hypothetical protein ASE07_05320 [Noviherbaspirillum sp. Root189]|nr:hypothetical protein ASE07_05320 [Noviherbaspirillum sp. Root189]